MHEKCDTYELKKNSWLLKCFLWVSSILLTLKVFFHKVVLTYEDTAFPATFYDPYFFAISYTLTVYQWGFIISWTFILHHFAWTVNQPFFDHLSNWLLFQHDCINSQSSVAKPLTHFLRASLATLSAPLIHTYFQNFYVPSEFGTCGRSLKIVKQPL